MLGRPERSGHLPWAASAEALPGRLCHLPSSAVLAVKDLSVAEGGVPRMSNPGASLPRPAWEPPPAHSERKDILQAFHQQGLPDSRSPEQETHPFPGQRACTSELPRREARLRLAFIGSISHPGCLLVMG